MKRIILLLLSSSLINAATQWDGLVPQYWGEVVPGVKTRLDTQDKVIALTFDACGSKTDGLDMRYIDFLEQEQIPATIFVTAKWIDLHPELFTRLQKSGLFNIENHGAQHLPASVNGNVIYNAKGTSSPQEFINEVENGAKRITQLTGKKPKFFRSGTAYYDEIAVGIVHVLGYEVGGFTLTGDAGTTFNEQQTRQEVLRAGPGAIVLLHINRPEKPCAPGAIAALKELKNRGYTFVYLEDYRLK